MPQASLDYQNASEHHRDRDAHRLRGAVLAAGIIGGIVVLAVIAFLIYAKYHETWSVKRHFSNSDDWEVVEIAGFQDDPEYHVTGVLLAAKGRPELTVRLGFHQYATLLENKEIPIVSINDVDAEDVAKQLLSDPRMTEHQRTELMFRQYYWIDVKDTGEFRALFPPIRDLKDLRARFDEVYATMRSLAAGPATMPAQRR